MESMELNKLKKVKRLIYIFSIVIPLAVALLFGVKIEGVDFSFLPPFYASINALTAVVLVGALLAIKSKNKMLHQRLIQFAFILSAIFLLTYVTEHSFDQRHLPLKSNYTGELIESLSIKLHIIAG